MSRAGFVTLMPPLPPSLRELRVADNALTSLPAFPSSLEILVCSHNKLRALDLSECADLKKLDVSHNQLESLGFSACRKLTHADVSHNRLKSVSSLAHLPLRELSSSGTCSLPPLRSLPR